MKPLQIPAAFAVAALTASIAVAQTFSGSHNNLPDCGTPQSGSIPNACAVEDKLQIGQCFNSPGCGSNLASVSSAYWSRVAESGNLEAHAIVTGNQLLAAPCGTGAGGIARVLQDMSANDIVFRRISDPTAVGAITVSLNVQFQGYVVGGPSCTGPAWTVFICAGQTTCSFSGQYDTGGGHGVLASYPNDNSTVVLSGSPYSAQLTLPGETFMRLDVNAKFGLCESGNPISTSVEAHGHLSLPTSGPVFNVPPDVTVDSAQLGIVDNQWLGPTVVIVGQPKAQLACSGGDAIFSLAATGVSPSYRWRRDGVELVDGPTGSGSTILGATSADLIVQAVSAADEASYDCVVSGSCGGAISAAAELSVAPAPSTYCTASSTSIAGCQAAIGAAGLPSLSNPSGFTVSSGNVPGGNLGICLFGDNGAASVPFGTLGGQICVQAPFFRSSPKAGGGTSGTCNGNFAFTLQDLINASPIVQPGASIHAEIWGRDPANPDAFLLSNGLLFTVCP